MRCWTQGTPCRRLACVCVGVVSSLATVAMVSRGVSEAVLHRCAFSPKRSPRTVLRHGFVVQGRRDDVVVLCAPEKTGSRFWSMLAVRGVLGRPLNRSELPKAEGGSDVGDELRRTIEVSRSPRRLELLSSPRVARYAIARNPYTRLLSAFRDKECSLLTLEAARKRRRCWNRLAGWDGHEGGWGDGARFASENFTVDRRRPGPISAALPRLVANFSEFVSVLTDDVVRANPHWRPQTMHCGRLCPSVGEWTSLRLEEIAIWWRELVEDHNLQSLADDGWQTSLGRPCFVAIDGRCPTTEGADGQLLHSQHASDLDIVLAAYSDPNVARTVATVFAADFALLGYEPCVYGSHRLC